MSAFALAGQYGVMAVQHAPGVLNSAKRVAKGIGVRGEGGYVICWFAVGLSCLDSCPLAPWPAAGSGAWAAPPTSPRTSGSKAVGPEHVPPALWPYIKDVSERLGAATSSVGLSVIEMLDLKEAARGRPVP